MTDIFHEVEEDLRRDRLGRLWTRYGSVFVTVAVLCVVATAAFVWWRQHQAAETGKRAEAFAAASAAIDDNKYGEGLALFTTLAADQSSGVAQMAAFRQAALLNAQGNIAGSLAAYDAIINASTDEATRSLARLQAARIVADSEDRDVLKNRLEPLLADGNPWRFHARELIALADMRKNDMAAAGSAFAALAADTAAPQTLRERAAKLAAFIQAGGVLPAPDAIPAHAADAAPPAVPAAPQPAVSPAASPAAAQP